MSAFAEMGNHLGSSEILKSIAEDVRLVEEELARQCRSEVELVTKVGLHTLEAGGKRLRPAFVALAARATGLPYLRDRVINLGACMEMIHMATLLHDDVVDNSPLRRGRPTASSVYGNTESILSGDVLLAKAMAILAQDGDLDIIRAVSLSVVEVAQGEVLELETRNDFDLSEEDHLKVLRMKTAALIEGCCVVGAFAAGADERTRDALQSYGHHIGMAFQIVDDLLDYRGDKEHTGKVRATDFREGCATLPLIYLRPKLSEQEREVARQKFGNGVMDDELAMISDWMRKRGAFDEAQAKANSHVQGALDALEALPETDARSVMEAMASFVLGRQS